MSVDRLAAADLMHWQADVGPTPHHIGGLVVLAVGGRPRADDLAAVLTTRLAGLPGLRRRPVRPPFGGGGWYWLADDVHPAAHVRTVPVGSGTGALLDAATAALTIPTPPGRSPWTATVLVDEDGTAAGIVVVLHHALADGIGGLAVLHALSDEGAGRLGEPSQALPAPAYRTLVADAWRRRRDVLRRLADPRAAVWSWRRGRAELGGGWAPRTVLNRPTGARRQVRVVDLDEAEIVSAAGDLGASVNDLVLVAAVTALGASAALAGRSPDHLVVSVPVAARVVDRVEPPRAPGSTRNAVGAMQISVPLVGALRERVRTVTGRRRARLGGERGDEHGRSLPLVLGAFRVLHALHLVRWFLDRQRLVNTFVTALPPTPGPVSLCGAAVAALVPLVPNQGNTTAAFATARHAGRLTVAVMTDPVAGPDGDLLAERLGAALLELARGSRPAPSPTSGAPAAPAR